jgi:SAM-dependent methyltransferase
MSPNEYLLKMLLGVYPNKQDFKRGLSWRVAFKDLKCLDLSCGDGRNAVLIDKLGMHFHATEVSDEICTKIFSNLSSLDITVNREDIRRGFNNDIPFDANMFDIVISWNGIYYLDNSAQDIHDNFIEVSRVLKPAGLFICSVPAPKCYSFIGSKIVGQYQRLISPSNVHNWGSGVQDGSYYYSFQSKQHLHEVLSRYFDSVSISELFWDGFGAPLHYYIMSGILKRS